MKTIAVIDDDINIGNMLEEVLHKEGYGVIRAYSGSEALLLLEKYRPDLVLLDLMLPGLSGEEVLPKIKNIPTIVVSAKLGIQDKVKLLLGGAVDYVTKPFETAELLARIQIRLRPQEPSQDGIITCGDLKLYEFSRELTVKEKPVRLTRTEYALVRILMQNKGQVIAKSVLLDHISQDTPDCMESSLKVHVSNLRKKLRDAGGKDYIEAVWGIGFKLIDE